MVVPFMPKQDVLPGLPPPVPVVDFARVQRDGAIWLDDMRVAIAQAADIGDINAVWFALRQFEDEVRHLTDLAGARLEKALEEM